MRLLPFSGVFSLASLRDRSEGVSDNFKKSRFAVPMISASSLKNFLSSWQLKLLLPISSVLGWTSAFEDAWTSVFEDGKGLEFINMHKAMSEPTVYKKCFGCSREWRISGLVVPEHMTTPSSGTMQDHLAEDDHMICEACLYNKLRIEADAGVGINSMNERESESNRDGDTMRSFLHTRCWKTDDDAEGMEIACGEMISYVNIVEYIKRVALADPNRSNPAAKSHKLAAGLLASAINIGGVCTFICTLKIFKIGEMAKLKDYLKKGGDFDGLLTNALVDDLMTQVSDVFDNMENKIRCLHSSLIIKANRKNMEVDPRDVAALEVPPYEIPDMNTQDHNTAFYYFDSLNFPFLRNIEYDSNRYIRYIDAHRTSSKRRQMNATLPSYIDAKIMAVLNVRGITLRDVITYITPYIIENVKETPLIKLYLDSFWTPIKYQKDTYELILEQLIRNRINPQPKTRTIFTNGFMVPTGELTVGRILDFIDRNGSFCLGLPQREQANALKVFNPIMGAMTGVNFTLFNFSVSTFMQLQDAIEKFRDLSTDITRALESTKASLVGNRNFIQRTFLAALETKLNHFAATGTFPSLKGPFSVFAMKEHSIMNSELIRLIDRACAGSQDMKTLYLLELVEANVLRQAQHEEIREALRDSQDAYVSYLHALALGLVRGFIELDSIIEPGSRPCTGLPQRLLESCQLFKIAMDEFFPVFGANLFDLVDVYPDLYIIWAFTDYYNERVSHCRGCIPGYSEDLYRVCPGTLEPHLGITMFMALFDHYNQTVLNDYARDVLVVIKQATISLIRSHTAENDEAVTNLMMNILLNVINIDVDPVIIYREYTLRDKRYHEILMEGYFVNRYGKFKASRAKNDEYLESPDGKALLEMSLEGRYTEAAAERVFSKAKSFEELRALMAGFMLEFWKKNCRQNFSVDDHHRKIYPVVKDFIKRGKTYFMISTENGSNEIDNNEAAIENDYVLQIIALEKLLENITL